MDKIFTAIGLMSGTSMDGIDAAILKTDGQDYAEPVGFITRPYDESFRERLHTILGQKEKSSESDAIEKDLTDQHVQIVTDILEEYDLKSDHIDVIGFHGHTVSHDPSQNFTWQIGDGLLLKNETGIPVVNNFRLDDVKQHGEGAPLLPIYHKVLAQKIENKNKRYAAFLNLGGVGNLTFIDFQDDYLLAFDTGPANAQLDDFVWKQTGRAFDKDGQIAMKGRIHIDIVNEWLSHPYFRKPPPKSLDRQEWDVSSVDDLSTEDGAATLATFSAACVGKGLNLLPVQPDVIYVCGGGRHNQFMMNALRGFQDAPVQPIEELGVNGDAVEAEGFAYMAVRHLLNLPITFPSTTGVREPSTGGVLFQTTDQ